MNQKGISSIVIILIIIGVLIIVGGVWYWQGQKEKPVACTQDAKLCPDGSYVSRTGLNCEFAACPEVKDETADWKTYRNEEYGFEVRYPNSWILTSASVSPSALLSLKSTEERISAIQSSLTIGITKNYKINPKDKEEISIGNHLGYKYFYQEGAGTSEVVLIQLGQDVLGLELLYFASDGSSFNERKNAIQGIMDPILSTFKFIK